MGVLKLPKPVFCVEFEGPNVPKPGADSAGLLAPKVGAADDAVPNNPELVLLEVPKVPVFAGVLEVPNPPVFVVVLGVAKALVLVPAVPNAPVPTVLFGVPNPPTVDVLVEPPNTPALAVAVGVPKPPVLLLELVVPNVGVDVVVVVLDEPNVNAADLFKLVSPPNIGFAGSVLDCVTFKFVAGLLRSNLNPPDLFCVCPLVVVEPKEKLEAAVVADVVSGFGFMPNIPDAVVVTAEDVVVPKETAVVAGNIEDAWLLGIPKLTVGVTDVVTMLLEFVGNAGGLVPPKVIVG